MLLLAAAVSALPACAPIKASRALADGQKAIEDALANEAPRYARYEFTKAVALMGEARSKEGTAEFEIAEKWASEARELATEASRTAARRKSVEAIRKQGKDPKTAPKRTPLRPPTPVLPPTLSPPPDLN